MEPQKILDSQNNPKQKEKLLKIIQDLKIYSMELYSKTNNMVLAQNWISKQECM